MRDIRRIVLGEGHIDRMVLSMAESCSVKDISAEWCSVGDIDRMVLSEGHIGRMVLREGHIGKNKRKRRFDENGDCTEITQLPADARRNCIGYV